jgi:ubiquinone/menaquinone biosynthesis C-methylase UbiE
MEVMKPSSTPVTRDVDGEILLAAHDLRDGRPELHLEAILVGRLAGLAGSVRFDQVVRAWQAPGMAGEDAIAGVFHDPASSLEGTVRPPFSTRIGPDPGLADPTPSSATVRERGRWAQPCRRNASCGRLSRVRSPVLLAHGVHLVGSVPLASAEAVFQAVAAALGDRVRRIPDGETGPRSDWIVWQLPVFTSRPELEVVPPGVNSWRPLPRVRLADTARAEGVRFEALGYADAAIGSYRAFARLKRDGFVPVACRFQVCLPTPLAPISAFVVPEHQDLLEPVYEERLLAELKLILRNVPHDQLAVQWDTNFEFGMLEGVFPVWFDDVKGGILERLLRLSRQVPPDVELGYHFCYGDVQHRHFKEPPDAGKLVDVANALAASLGRRLNWIHMPAPRDRVDDAYYAPLGELRLRPETELYLGLVHHRDGTEGTARRIEVARRFVSDFGIATECGWGRRAPATIPELFRIHRDLSVPVQHSGGPRPRFHWPPAFLRVPDEDWTRQPVDTFGQRYDTVENHGWYRNLDPTVEDLARHLEDGHLLIDYSGGTGILLDRLKLRIFDRQVGLLIVDSSPKFLRVALDKFGADERVAFRLLHWLKDAKRLELLEEVIGPELGTRGADAIASTNAIHLYLDLPQTLASWARALRPGGRAFVQSGNIRNPEARPSEWILDETVWAIHEVATGLVRNDPRYLAYRPMLDDEARMQAYVAYRDRVFLPVRPLDYYRRCLEGAGLTVEDVTARTIETSVEDWFEFLSAYHEAVLGWVGGSAKVEGRAPVGDAVRDRLALIRHAMDTLFGGRGAFQCCWTYINARRP